MATYTKCKNVLKDIAVNMDLKFTKKMDLFFKDCSFTFDYNDLPYNTSHIIPSKRTINENIYSNCVPYFVQSGIYHNPSLFMNFIPGYKENLYLSPGFFNEYIDITVNETNYKSSEDLTNNFGKDDLIDIIKNTSRKEFDTLYDIHYFKATARIYDFQQVLALVAEHTGVEIEMTPKNMQDWINLVLDLALSKHKINKSLFAAIQSRAEYELEEIWLNLRENPIKKMVCVHDLGKDWCWDDAVAIMFEGLLKRNLLINELHIIGAGADPMKATENSIVILNNIMDLTDVYYYTASGSADTDRYGPQWVGLLQYKQIANYKNLIPPREQDIFSNKTTVDILAICAETSFIKDLKKGIHANLLGIQGGFVKDDGFNATQDKESTNKIMINL